MSDPQFLQWLKEGRLDAAIASLQNKKDPPSLDQLASLYEITHKPLDAINTVTQHLKLHPQSASYLCWYRGLLYLKVQLPGLAEPDFEYVITNSSTLFSLGVLARSYARLLLGDVQGALLDSDSIDPNTTLVIDRIVTPSWIKNIASTWLHRNQTDNQ